MKFKVGDMIVPEGNNRPWGDKFFKNGPEKIIDVDITEFHGEQIVYIGKLHERAGWFSSRFKLAKSIKPIKFKDML